MAAQMMVNTFDGGAALADGRHLDRSDAVATAPPDPGDPVPGTVDPGAASNDTAGGTAGRDASKRPRIWEQFAALLVVATGGRARHVTGASPSLRGSHA